MVGKNGKSLVKVTIWDMPGIDGFDHKISEYVTKNNLDSNKFQFVLIVFSQELGTDASYLVREFLDRKVFFYLIRTHINITIMKGQKLRKSETEVLEKVKATTKNQLSNLQTRDLSGYHRTLEDGKDYQFYMVDASDRTRFDFAGLLNDIEINLHIDSRKQMAEKVNLIWQNIVKERIDSLNEKSSEIISNCAAADTVPFKSKSIKLIQLTIKMLQTFQLCKKISNYSKKCVELKQDTWNKLSPTKLILVINFSLIFDSKLVC